MTLFPVVQPEATVVAQPSAALPLAREVQWDFNLERPVFRRGEPVIVTGLVAVTVWAWHALHTPRFRHEIYTWAYGSEIESLIGQAYTEALKQAEAQRYVREALEPNPYITGVKDVVVAFEGPCLTISCTIQTIYGSEEVTSNLAT